MCNNNNTGGNPSSSDGYPNDMEIIGNIDPYFDDTIALPADDLIHERLTFDSDHTFRKRYMLSGKNVSLYIITADTNAHENGSDGSYSFKISSTNTSLTCELYDMDEISAPLVSLSGMEINFASLLPDNKTYKIRIVPNVRDVLIEFDVEISYAVYRNIGQINVDDINKGVTIRKYDKCTLHFNNSIENNCTWISSNPSVISVGRTSGQITAHKLGKATITFSSSCCSSHSIVVRSVIDYIDILPDGINRNKVVFRSTGKTWHCVYQDVISEDPLNIAAITAKRNNMNYFADFDEDENKPLSDKIKEFSDEELRALYSIDPLGVANYINRYTDGWGVTEAINKKDKCFKLFFEREPKYFARDIHDEWGTVSKPTGDLSHVLSESELIMGEHLVKDFAFWRDLLKGTLDLIVSFVPAPRVISGFLNVYNNLSALTTIFSFCTCDDFNDFMTDLDVVGNTESFLGELYENTEVDWVSGLLGTASTIFSFVNSININNNLYMYKFDYCIKDDNFEVHIHPHSGSTFTLEECRKNIPNN